LDIFEFYLKNPDRHLTGEVGYSPGRKFSCPRCDSLEISLFFKPGFPGREIENWRSIIKNGTIELCNKYEIIIKHNNHPNWICKNCYDGGVVLKL
jgi:transcription elongation factor Elf1